MNYLRTVGDLRKLIEGLDDSVVIVGYNDRDEWPPTTGYVTSKEEHEEEFAESGCDTLEEYFSHLGEDEAKEMAEEGLSTTLTISVCH